MENSKSELDLGYQGPEARRSQWEDWEGWNPPSHHSCHYPEDWARCGVRYVRFVCVSLIVLISDRSMEDLQEEVLTFLTCAKPGNWEKTSKNTSFDIFILVSGFPTTWTTFPPSLPALRIGEQSQIKYCSTYISNEVWILCGRSPLLTCLSQIQRRLPQRQLPKPSCSPLPWHPRSLLGGSPRQRAFGTPALAI